MHGLDTWNVSSRVESSRDEPSGIWALLDVRARRLENSGYSTNEIDCLISSVCGY